MTWQQTDPPPPRLHPPWCPGLKKERPSQFLHLKNPVPESTHPSSGSRGSMAVWRHHSDHAGCCGIHLRFGTLKRPTTDDACSWHQAWLQLYNQSKESYESFIWGAASIMQQQLHSETAGNEEKLQEVGDLQAFVSGNSWSFVIVVTVVAMVSHSKELSQNATELFLSFCFGGSHFCLEALSFVFKGWTWVGLTTKFWVLILRCCRC